MTKSTGTTKIYMSCTEDTALRTNYGCLLQLLGGIKCGYSLPEVDILPQKYLSFFFFLMFSRRLIFHCMWLDPFPA